MFYLYIIMRLVMSIKRICYVRKFSYESTGERILKIDPHLPKL